MLNISKISKMFLVLGMVTAFSCVTLNVNVAYADACTDANKAVESLKKEHKKAGAVGLFDSTGFFAKKNRRRNPAAVWSW